MWNWLGGKVWDKGNVGLQNQLSLVHMDYLARIAHASEHCNCSMLDVLTFRSE